MSWSIAVVAVRRNMARAYDSGHATYQREHMYEPVRDETSRTSTSTMYAMQCQLGGATVFSLHCSAPSRMLSIRLASTV